MQNARIICSRAVIVVLATQVNYGSLAANVSMFIWPSHSWQTKFNALYHMNKVTIGVGAHELFMIANKEYASYCKA